jgi:uncharacterized membrane protein
MEKMLVAVFDNETKAFEGLSALKDLHQNGDITLYANAVVSVDANGQLNIKQITDNDGLGTTTGLLIGSLVGILGGPIGLAVGATAGTMAGFAADIDEGSINAAFVEEVSSKLTKGKTALIADIGETWPVPVDTRLGELDGIVFRRLHYEVEDDMLRRETEAMVAEYNEWEEEIKEGIDTDKAKVNKALTNLREKANMTKQRMEQKLDEVDKELSAKLEKIEQQMNNASEKRKARLQKRRTALKEEHRIREEKLRQATGLIKEAFEPKMENAV